MSSEQAWQRDKADFVQPAGSRAAGALDTEFTRRRGDLGPLAAQFATLAAQLFSAGTAADVLDTIIHAAAALVPEADFVSITMRKNHTEFDTPATTDDLALRLDQAQYELQEGPCIDATRRGGTGISADPDLGASDQWSKFGPAAAELGVRSVLSFGLMPTAPTPRLGALNFYARAPRALLGADRDTGLLLAAHAGAALAAARSVEAADLRVAQLEQALLSRDVIGQAKGMLMAQRGISAAQAFDVLRTASQYLNVKLAKIAEAIATRKVEL
ncbi:ANTAR domain-containing protein [Pseudonocardia acidicola]|uniref:ANTAR domain-containing protein n=1 Tax=Pseudonocardia acidicola TaxID=2724939 RepID=A0ABX1SMS7_9PSEU|nr:ANTAR domain-containing protein [Pseudonocardia acidicola]NMI02113.1 ANTAR domain-containing protein [Pseudonocardia acidicola]